MRLACVACRAALAVDAQDGALTHVELVRCGADTAAACLPLLVPEEALAYLGDGLAGLSDGDDDSVVFEAAPADAYTVDGLLEPALPPHELVTLLICDGCEGEFDIAQLTPPLREIPQGDWFCGACAGVAPLPSADVPLVHVTVLICDGCDGEFELEALVPPLAEVPAGDWFCSSCAALRTAQSTAKSRRSKSGKRPVAAPKRGPAAVAQPPPPAAPVVGAALEELVTLLICDGCDGEFDAALLALPLTEIPQGDWFCGACSAAAAARSSSSRRRPSASMQATASLSVGADSGDAEAGDGDERNGAAADAEKLEDDDGQAASARGLGRKRKRSIGYQAKRRGKQARADEAVPASATPVSVDEAERVEPEPVGAGIRIPQPVVVRASSAGSGSSSNNDDKGGGATTTTTTTTPQAVLVSDDDGDELEDAADDAVVIVCDMCLADFNMIDVVGTAAAKPTVPPPRPWYCTTCVRSLKRTRKKRQRFSKQMLMEMQLYGELLRPTSAKAYDVKAAALRGKPPRTTSELKVLFELVGRRVGVYLKWDKHWVLGRVLSFEASHPAFHHVVRFEDGVEKSLPLYAFPLVVGTRSMVYVQVPALQNQWWPGQILRLNPLAKKLLLPDDECASAVANFRLVSIYAAGECKGQTQNVSCWVPKHLCRSLPKFQPHRGAERLADDDDANRYDPHVGSSDFTLSMTRALAEPGCEEAVLKVAFQRLVQHVCRQGPEQMREFGRALVGLELVDTAHDGSRDSTAGPPIAAVVTRFDDDAHELVLELDNGEGDPNRSRRVALRADERRFFLRKPCEYAEVAVRFSNSSIADVESQQQDATRAALDAAISSMPISRDTVGPRDGQSPGRDCAEASCALCLLPAETAFEGAVDGPSEALVACVKCADSFHLACCDPPHDPTPLLNDDDGSVMLDDVKAPFVCSKCTTCVGCAKRHDGCRDAAARDDTAVGAPRWSQWRLPLQVAALCADCVPYYQAKQYCTVCLLVLNDDDLATCISLHACSTCHLWVHTACEPDPHPALLAWNDSADFELDVQLELPATPTVSGPLGVAVGTPGPSSSSAVAVKAAPSELVPAKDGDAGDSESKHTEAFAFGLKFRDGYNPKSLHKFECFACRKVRMLQVVHRLKAEDKLELFKEPVTKAIAPTYFDVIKEPMDLGSMQAKVLANAYTRADFRDLRDDFELLCLNAVTFNSKERDFLIWREAWRYYGQGQRILRQTAPKSRMKHRGGKYHDALVAAAKRQLPNNSAFGKTRDGFSGASAADDGAFLGSAHGDPDDDLDMADERGDPSNEAVVARDAVNGSADAGGVAGVGSAAAKREPHAMKAENGTSAVDLPGVGVAATVFMSGRSSGSLVAPSSGERTAPAAQVPVVLQSALGEPPKPHAAPAGFTMVQARAAAHTYAWLDMCFACGSAGVARDLLFCVDCGEGFHAFCVPGMSAARVEASVHLQAFWRCANCAMCEGCGQPAGDSALHVCRGCESGFHGACLVPAIPAASDDDDEEDEGGGARPPIYCASCVSCQDCGREQPELAYSYDRESCLSCSQAKQFETTLKQEKSKPLAQLWAAHARRQKNESEKCPMCRLRWSPDDEELIQCDACELWAHPQCDALLTREPARYKTLVEDPSAPYICGVCRPKERAHVAGVPGSWTCQLLVETIQQQRVHVDATWREARAQLALAKQWKFWRDHTPVYLYLLRLGEECLKSLALRSVNFRANWSRRSKELELTGSGAVAPAWLVQKASRYVRFKRYARGPKAALRRQDRKASSFYSRLGLEKHKDASVVATIVSEACSCAALLACVQLFYGWRPLPKVALHLLSSDAASEQGHERLSDATLQALSQGGADMTLEDEIAMINRQYERRVGKKPVVRDPNDAAASDATARERPSDESGGVKATLTGNHDPAASSASAKATVATTALSSAPSSAPTAPLSAVVSPPTEPATEAAAADTIKVEPVASTALVASVTTSAAPTQVVQMTRAAALSGWPSTESSDSDSAPPGALPASPTRPKFVDNRFCAFCFMIGDDLICGRLIYTDKDQWVHVNCALWSVEVFESADGVLQKCQKAKNRSRLLRCDACGVLGASVGCAVSRCQRHYHFPCAYDYGVVFLPNGDTVCAKPDHIAMVSRKQKLAVTPRVVAAVELSADAATPLTPQEVPIAPTPSGGDDGERATRTTSVDAVTDSTSVDAEEKAGLDDSASVDAALADSEAPTTDEMPSAAPKEPATPAAPAPAEPASEPSVDVKEEERAVAASVASPPAPVLPAPVLPVVDPSSEPRRHLRSDLPVVLSDLKKQGSKSRRQKRTQCLRLGALTVQSFGHIVVGNPSFHSRDAIFPLGFRSTRIFWSARARATRCLYECTVTSTAIEERLKSRKRKVRDDDGDATDDDDDDARAPARAVFKLVASDDRSRPIVAFSPDGALAELRARIAALYDDPQCFGVAADKNPFVTRTSWGSYGLSSAHFFGFGVPAVVAEIEQLPHAATTGISRHAIATNLAKMEAGAGARRLVGGAPDSATVHSSSGGTDTDTDTANGVYVFTQSLPTPKQFDDALREVEQLVVAEQRARLSSGSTRTDGYEGDLVPDGDAPRVAPLRRRLDKQARPTPETLLTSTVASGSSSSNSNSSSGANSAAGASGGTGGVSSSSGAGSSGAAGSGAGGGGTVHAKSSGGVAMDLEHLPIAMQYRELRRRPFDERLEVRKSKIHGYGLFATEPMAEGQMIVEYQGQLIAQDAADEREKQYEEVGIGSCYMFRLDDRTIIDATRVGNLARFINHSCDPKAYARVVVVEGNEKKIVIFAKRAIEAGDEVTYDYKFPIEDEAIRCDCSAPNCVGRMN
ncbi:hypothetical protein PybrP1_006478 [[Pythium] brassicae (nom. inval.)]|nr:hypothetical protein PybrP1_006478 [[Pythium] brassicae (nom. inval.)]